MDFSHRQIQTCTVTHFLKNLAGVADMLETCHYANAHQHSVTLIQNYMIQSLMGKLNILGMFMCECECVCYIYKILKHAAAFENPYMN